MESGIVISSKNVSQCRELKDPATHPLCFREEIGTNRLRSFEVKESAQEHRVCGIKEMVELDGKLKVF